MEEKSQHSSSIGSKSSFELAASLLKNDRQSRSSTKKTPSDTQNNNDKHNKHNNTNNMTNNTLSATTLIPVYDGGSGGLGIDQLNFTNIQQKQWEMFRRTIELQAPRQLENLLQEKRQIQLTSPQRKITVSVCREDFPSVKAFIDIVFDDNASQKAWGPFLSEVAKKLQVEFIYSIIERGDKAPIFRILRLKDGGDYLVRQRESSAVLEVLNTSIAPIETSWEVTKDIVAVKQDLAFGLKNIHRVNDRILHLVSQPMTTKTQQDITNQIKNIVRADGIIELINHLYLSNTSNAYLLDMKVESLNLNYNQIPFFQKHKKIDIIAIHRQAIEKINLLATLGQSEIVVKECLHYLFNVLMDLIYEVDIVVMGLKLLSDIVPHLLLYREKMFNVVLDCIQYYSPQSPYHRPRKAFRVVEKQKLKAAAAAVATAGEGGDSSLYADLSMPTITSSYSNHATGLSNRSFDNNSYGFGRNAGNMTPEMLIEQMEFKSTFLRLVKDTPESTLQQMNTVTRYPVDRYAIEDEKSIYRKDTQSMAIYQYAKVIELDENLQILTPRTKALRKEQTKGKARTTAPAPAIRAISPSNRQSSLQDLAASKLISNRPSLVKSEPSSPSGSKPSSRISSPAAASMRKELSSSTMGSNSEKPDQTNSKKTVAPTAKNIINERRNRRLSGSNAAKDDDSDEKDSKNGNEDRWNDDNVPRDRSISISTLPKLVENDSENNSIVSSLKSKDQPPRHHQSSVVDDVAEEQVKPSAIIDTKKKKKNYRIKKKIDYEQEKIEELSSPIRWKGSVGEIGRRAAAPEAVDANRILSSTKRKQNILPTINTGQVAATVLGSNNPSSKPGTPTDGDGGFARQRSRSQSIRFATDEANDTSSEMNNNNNNNNNNGNIFAAAENTNNSTASSPASSSLRRQSTRRALRRRSSRMSQQSEQSDQSNETKTTTEEDEKKESIEGGEDPSIAANSAAPSSNEGNNPDWIPDISTTILRKQKPKYRLEPLPITEFPHFRIFDSQMKENVVLIQGFATMLKILLNSFGNRDYAFRNNILMELAEIVIVCPAIPKILEYFLEMFHVLYVEGIGDPLDITWQEAEDPSMVLSAEDAPPSSSSAAPVAAGGAGGGGGEGDVCTVTTASSKYFDAISEMSMPTVDPDEQRSMISISDNKYNTEKNDKQRKTTIALQPTSNTSQPQAIASTAKTIATNKEKQDNSNNNNRSNEAGDEREEKGGGEGGEDVEEDAPKDIIIQHISAVASIHSVNAVAARPKEKNKPEETDTGYATSKQIAKFTKRQKLKYNEEILSRIGLSEYDLRYRKMPDDAVILALAMCSNHIEVKETLREEALFWLEHFDDLSRDFYLLKRKGGNLANLS